MVDLNGNYVFHCTVLFLGIYRVAKKVSCSWEKSDFAKREFSGGSIVAIAIAASVFKYNKNIGSGF